MELTKREREQLLLKGSDLINKAMGFGPGDAVDIEYRITRAGNDVEELTEVSRRGSQVRIKESKE